MLRIGSLASVRPRAAPRATVTADDNDFGEQRAGGRWVPGLRSLWSAHTPAPLTQTAFALDAAVFDLAFITGPVLATGLAPAAAVAVLLALTGAALITIAGPSSHLAHPSGQPGHREPPATTRSRFGPLRSAALRRLLISAALTNAALSATEVALTAYVRHHHALWASGPLLAGTRSASLY